MKESMWGWWFIVLGIIIMAVVILITDMTTTSEQNYYMIKEVNEAAMMEAVDYGYYRKYGILRINSEKYMENFIRRFSEMVTINKRVKIGFYDIYESPPKVTVIVTMGSNQFISQYGDMNMRIENRIDAILEMQNKQKPSMN